MMLGTAARSSIVVDTGRFSQAGQSWVRKTAMPSETGTPMTRAMRADVSVPTMATKAPNWSRPTSQALEVRKPRPKRSKAGQPP